MGSGVRKEKSIKNPFHQLDVWEKRKHGGYNVYRLHSASQIRYLKSEGVIYNTNQIRRPDRFVEYNMKSYWKTYNKPVNGKKVGVFPVLESYKVDK